MNSTVRRVFAAFLAGAPVITRSSFAQTTPGKETEAQALVRSIAEATKIDRLVFENAEINECIAYIRKKSIEHSPEKDPDRKGLNFISKVKGEVKPVTIDLRNVSLWEAVHKVAAAAGVEVRNDGQYIIVEDKVSRPSGTPGVPGFEESLVWKRAAGIVIDRMVFSEASVSDACATLKAKSRKGDEKQKGVEITTAGEFRRTLTMDIRNVRLSDAIKAVAEVGGAEITVSGEKIILKPAKAKK